GSGFAAALADGDLAAEQPVTVEIEGDFDLLPGHVGRKRPAYRHRVVDVSAAAVQAADFDLHRRGGGRRRLFRLLRRGGGRGGRREGGGDCEQRRETLHEVGNPTD